jgi:hypothetical protein
VISPKNTKPESLAGSEEDRTSFQFPAIAMAMTARVRGVEGSADDQSLALPAKQDFGPDDRIVRMWYWPYTKNFTVLSVCAAKL